MTRMAITALLALIALAAGAGIGLLITKPQMAAKQTEIDSLSSELEQLRAKSDQQEKTSAAEINGVRNQLARAENEKSRINTELIRTKSELVRLENALKQFAAPEAAPAPTAIPAAAASPQIPAAVPASNTALKAAAGEYVVKEGDSFWKIASEQLGSGARYQQVIDLNPQIDPKRPLAVGTKLKLPQK